jgi:pimeloyl-ACP methyl ester carboxylesterase
VARFLLIHGASHGAWCWRDVVTALTAAGHATRALDLPGHGADPTPPGSITLGTYVDAILASIEAPAVVVGHSMAGMWISAAAEAAPDRIARLVYIAAWAPEDGQSARDLRQAGGSDLVRAATRPGDASFSYADEALEELFYNDCPPGTLDFARPRLVPEPTRPAQTPVRLTARYASVPRSYIRCMDDRTILPAAQVRMTEGWTDVHDLPCGHSPFFAMPARLADILSKIAEAS